MNVLITCDAFKGSLSAMEVCQAILNGINKANPDINCRIFPMADGGEGTLDVLKAHMSIKQVEVDVQDPLGRLINTSYFVSGKTAFIELARASGYILLDEDERNPMFTSSMGTGQQIKHAIDCGVDKVYLFLGGSATNDAATGIAYALGFRFRDASGNELKPIGANLHLIQYINLPVSDLSHVSFTILCDVKNPLYGPTGAAFTYAAQKGASPEEIAQLDIGLKQFASVVYQQLGKDISQMEGGGAAGGVSAGMVGLFNGKLERGFDCISEISGLEQAISESDIVISGEGQIDRQTMDGKLIYELANLCLIHKKPLSLIVGNNKLNKDDLHLLGIEKVDSVMDKASDLEDAIQNASKYIEEIAREAFILP